MDQSRHHKKKKKPKLSTESSSEDESPSQVNPCQVIGKPFEEQVKLSLEETQEKKPRKKDTDVAQEAEFGRGD